MQISILTRTGHLFPQKGKFLVNEKFTNISEHDIIRLLGVFRAKNLGFPSQLISGVFSKNMFATLLNVDTKYFFCRTLWVPTLPLLFLFPFPSFPSFPSFSFPSFPSDSKLA